MNVSHRLVGWLLGCFVASLAVLLVPASPAEAQTRFRRPFDNWFRVSAYYDNNGSAAGCRDWNCASQCYDGHGGTDYAMPVGTAVLAAAPGTVVGRHDGCADYGSLGNTCGGRCGNYIRLRHDDGTQTIYCHMQRGSLRVNMNDRVGCGQRIGSSASSGSSTGPHLHFGFYPGGTGASRDPYHGACAGGGSVWVAQGGHGDNPSTECQSTCACSPGERQAEGCGRCGRRERVCGGNCQWGGWSGCSGEGACSPGQRESVPCCDCGTQERVCSSGCAWGDWGECAGPDPQPAQACDTGEPGVCADGTRRCVAGCLACARNTEPTSELCDDRDNDCDGRVDEGRPELAADAVPAFAALRVDSVLPNAVDEDGLARGWIAFRNVGTEAWPRREALLRVHGDADVVASLRDEATWPAWDVAAASDREVPPGDTVRLTFALRPPASLDARRVPVRFALESLRAGAIACPIPDQSHVLAFVLDAPDEPGFRPPWLRWDTKPADEGERDTASEGSAPQTRAAVPPTADEPTADEPSADEPAPGTAGAANGDTLGEPPPGGDASRARSQAGCAATAPSAPSGAWWLLGALGAVTLRRRRSTPSRGSLGARHGALRGALMGVLGGALGGGCDSIVQQPFEPLDAAADASDTEGADTDASTSGRDANDDTSDASVSVDLPDGQQLTVSGWSPRSVPWREGGLVVFEGAGLEAVEWVRVGGLDAQLAGRADARLEVRMPARAFGGETLVELYLPGGDVLELPFRYDGVEPDALRWVPAPDAAALRDVGVFAVTDGGVVVWTPEGLGRFRWAGPGADAPWEVSAPPVGFAPATVEPDPDAPEPDAPDPDAPDEATFQPERLCRLADASGTPLWWLADADGRWALMEERADAFVPRTPAPQAAIEPAVAWHCTRNGLVASRDGAVWRVDPTAWPLDRAPELGRPALEAGASVGDVLHVDLDGDGVPDWLLSFADDAPGLWLGADDGAVTRAAPDALPSGETGELRWAAGALGGERPVDLVVRRPDGSLALWQHEAGRWRDASGRWAGLADAEPARRMLLADFDRDGRTDLVSVRDDGRLVLLRNAGDERLMNHSFTAFPPGRAPVRAVAWIDLDGDLDDDLLVVTDDGSLRPWLLWDPAPWVDGDGDGFPDAVDLCPDVYDPEQRDSEGDGVGDACRTTELPDEHEEVPE